MEGMTTLERLKEMLRRHKMLKPSAYRLKYGQMKMSSAQRRLWEAPNWRTEDLVKVS
jgi:hypothetical protein